MKKRWTRLRGWLTRRRIEGCALNLVRVAFTLFVALLIILQALSIVTLDFVSFALIVLIVFVWFYAPIVKQVKTVKVGPSGAEITPWETEQAREEADMRGLQKLGDLPGRASDAGGQSSATPTQAIQPEPLVSQEFFGTPTVTVYETKNVDWSFVPITETVQGAEATVFLRQYAAFWAMWREIERVYEHLASIQAAAKSVPIPRGVPDQSRFLVENGVIEDVEYELTIYLMSIRNRVMHGAMIQPGAGQNIDELSLRLLRSLSAKQQPLREPGNEKDTP